MRRQADEGQRYCGSMSAELDQSFQSWLKEKSISSSLAGWQRFYMVPHALHLMSMSFMREALRIFGV